MFEREFSRYLCFEEYPDVLLNEVSVVSRWPHKLLGLEECPVKVRERQGVVEEYNSKHAAMLQALAQVSFHKYNNATQYFIKVEAERLRKGNLHNTLVSYNDDAIKNVQTFENSVRCHAWFVVLYVGKCLGDETVIVELGAGVGKNIAFLMDAYSQIKRGVSCDIADNCNRYAEMVAGGFGLNIDVYKHNHYAPDPSVLKHCRDAIVFTYQSIEQLPHCPEVLIDEIISAGPRKVIHFEPINENYFNNDRMLNILRRKYRELNDYNSDLLTVLRQYEKMGKLDILLNDVNVFGNNIFNPLSVLIWKPRNQ